MRVALAQINSVLGDFENNRKKILDYTRRACERRCDLVVFPESCLFGYHPSDLLERESIVQAQMKEFKKLERELPAGIVAVIGLFRPNPQKRGKRFFNSAAVMTKGRKTIFFNKELLPAYDVFDDSRHIEQGQIVHNFFTVRGKKILLTICEDLWAWDHPRHRAAYRENPLLKLKGKKIDFIINLSASPTSHNKISLRTYMTKKTATTLKAPLVYVNLVGGQDELIFDGGSFAIDARGKRLAQCLYFAEDLNVVDFALGRGGLRPPFQVKDRIRQALVLGIRDFFFKIGIKQAIIGLSGGIDSAVVACLAADALSPNRVITVGMPGPFSSPESLQLARQLANNLGCRWLELPIDSVYQQILINLTQVLGTTKFGLMHENLQARTRGLLLMALSNHYESSMVLTTGNKDEYATGYTTLYGDMCGGLAPIADLVKSEVYQLANVYNEQTLFIPQGIIDRAPSAELRPNQRDSDDLPPFDQLDRGIRRLVEQCKPATSAADHWLVRAMMNSEFKRWQAPPILKISDHAFGRGRRFPIANRSRA